MKPLVFLVALLSLCTACNRTPPPWKRQDLKETMSCTYSTRFYYTPPCEHSDFGFSLISNKCETRAEFYLLCGRFQQTGAKQQIKAVYSIDNQKFEDNAVLMKGSQEVRFSKAASERILEALASGKDVFIQVGRFKALIEAGNFAKLHGEWGPLRSCFPSTVHYFAPFF